MKFHEIKKSATVYPGEYLLHIPTSQIVLCGAFRRAQGTIKAIATGRLIEDKIENFKKIEREQNEFKSGHRGCSGCKGR